MLSTRKRKGIIGVMLLVALLGIAYFFQAKKKTDPFWVSIPLYGEVTLHSRNQEGICLIDFEKTLAQAAQDPQCKGVILFLNLDIDEKKPRCYGICQALVNAIKHFQASNKKVIAYTGTREKSDEKDVEVGLENSYIASCADEWRHNKNAFILLSKEEEEASSAASDQRLSQDTIPKILFSITWEGKYKIDIKELYKVEAQQYRRLMQEIYQHRPGLNHFVKQPASISPQKAKEIRFVDQLVDTASTPPEKTVISYQHYLTSFDFWRIFKLHRLLIVDIDGDLEKNISEQQIEDLEDRITRCSMAIFVINTPGGSEFISRYIGSCIQKAREKNIPVITIATSCCLSGGLMISAYTDKILAYPTTIVGSLGVRQSIIYFHGFFKSFGIDKNTPISKALAKMNLPPTACCADMIKEYPAFKEARDEIFPHGLPSNAYTLLTSFGGKDAPIGDVMKKIFKNYKEWCIFDEEDVKRIRDDLEKTYQNFLDTVLQKNGQDRATFDAQFGQGRLFIAAGQGEKAGFVDKIIENKTLLSVIAQLAKEHGISSYMTIPLKIG